MADAGSIEHGWIHPEGLIYSAQYLSDTSFDHFGLDFHLTEAGKIFWWEQHVDMGQGRILTALFQLIDIKFRAWLFRHMPPHPAVSMGWFVGMICSTALLYNFTKKYLILGAPAAAAITSLFLLSPASAGYTFQYLHPGKMLAVFFLLVVLNLVLLLRGIGSGSAGEGRKGLLLWIVLGLTLFFSLFTDPLVFITFLLIPVFFPEMFRVCFKGGNRSGGQVYAVYLAVIVCYAAAVFLLIPYLSRLAGYEYGFLAAVKEAKGNNPFMNIVNPWFYYGVMMNTYWFVTGNIGLRGYLPLYISEDRLYSFDPSHYAVEASLGTLAPLVIVHLVLIALSVADFKYSDKRYILKSVLALYITTGWITLIHSFQNVLLPWSTYYYGSVFSVVFVMLIGALLRTLRGRRGLSYAAVAVVLIASFSAYGDAKEINRAWKYSRYPEVDIDGFYRSFRDHWHEIKKNPERFDKTICMVDKGVSFAFQRQRITPLTECYKISLWHQLSRDYKNVRALNFAGFCPDRIPSAVKRVDELRPLCSTVDAGSEVMSSGTANPDIVAVRASSQWQDYGPQLVFDGVSSDASSWHSSFLAPLPQWIEPEYAHPRIMISISIQAQNDHRYAGINAGRAPQAFMVQGSNDRKHYAELLKVNDAHLRPGEWGEWRFENSRAYKYYRVCIRENYGDCTVAIQEMLLK
ncbi:MAG: XRE family transcriptional regulator [Nitrospirae bacterium]|nr:MAG: XRE family transcriptional regulator [Nitrospirota bacterium]